jgi:hypothetical protein
MIWKRPEMHSKRDIKRFLILFSILLCAFFALGVQAQVQNSDIVLNLAPSVPRANENVRASVSSYTTDLNKSYISWLLNGETILEGVGKKTFSFNVGEVGSQTTIEVKIMTSDGSSLDKKAVLVPSDIDLLWEAYNSYVPPFYKGKALAVGEGVIKVVALSSSNSEGGVTYNWKQDGKNKLNSSGYGKNFYLFKNSYLDDSNTVEAIISGLFGNSSGSGKITIVPGSPKIVFYKKDSLFGVQWEKALSDGFILNKNGETLVAEPYFFYPKDLNSSDLSFTWSLNGTQIPTPSQKNIMSLKSDGKSGSAQIKLSITNLKTLFQAMEKQLNVNF